MHPKLGFIFARRSVRRFQGKPVADGDIRALLEAAMAAPSACAKDPWDFVVVRDRDRLARVAEGLPNGKFLAAAGVGIVVCGSLERAHGGELSYLLQDCSAAIENLLLAASALGLGTCWLGVHPRQERVANLRAQLGIPEAVLPVSVIAVGWPAESPAARTRFREERVHGEAW